MADAMVDAWLGKLDGGRRFHGSDSPACIHRQTTVRLSQTIVRWSEFAILPSLCMVCTNGPAYRKPTKSPERRRAHGQLSGAPLRSGLLGGYWVATPASFLRGTH